MFKSMALALMSLAPINLYFAIGYRVAAGPISGPKGAEPGLGVSALRCPQPSVRVRAPKKQPWPALSLTRRQRPRRGAGVVERAGLENRSTLAGTVGSNPTLSASFCGKPLGYIR